MADELQQNLPGIAARAAQDAGSDGPGAMSVTPGPGGGPLVTLPMTADEVGEWWDRVRAARERLKREEVSWDILLREYLPTVSASGTPETVKTNGHFRNVHTKIGQLFYRSPELRLTPEGVSLDQVMDPATGAILTPEDIVTVKQSVLNKKLGRDGINGVRLMDELLFDVLAWAGIGCCKVGYIATTKPVPEPVMQPDPNFVPPIAAPGAILDINTPEPQPPMVPVLGPDGQPMTRIVQVPVHEDWYARRVSPKKLLFDDNLRSTRYSEDATWIAIEFFMSPRMARRIFKLTDEQVANATAEDDRVFKHDSDQAPRNSKRGMVHGIEIWCKAAWFTDEVHPLAINQLILIEGVNDKPIVWRPSPDQTFDQTGRLTQDSLTGFPIKVLTIRDLADSPFPKSDSAYTNSLIKQMNTHRRQSVMLRDAAIGKYFYDQGAFDPPEIDILKNGEVGAFVGVIEGKLDKGADKILVPTPKVEASRDDYRTAVTFKQDMDETLGINSNSAGAPEDTVRTATEIASIQTAVASRNEKEQSRAIDFWLDLARAVDKLLMRYATVDQYVQITGEDGVRKLMMWNNKIIAGEYMYEIAPDSQLKIDTARDRQQFMNYYNLTAADPLNNRVYTLRRLARMFGQDPGKAVLQPVMAMEQIPHGGGAVNKHESGKSGDKGGSPGSSDHRKEQEEVAA